uniref:polynucleotide adenylyltransferase n=1 Tax=Chenopodium quinoa TaxID=63459 RepID=A0A803L1J3_CHEQI
MDVHRSLSLLQFVKDGGLVPSSEETLKRESIIHSLKKIVQHWITKVAWQRKLPENLIRDASATILTYGSFGLGVHNSESDIDVLCVGPGFATMEEDFCIVLYNILKGKPEVSEINCVKDAKVPLMRFKFKGVAVDMPYAKLQVTSVPENVDLLNPMFLVNIDETSWKSLSGVRVNQCILQLVPNLENFQSLLRCIKSWAKQRGIYGNLFGYLGGIHLAILSAFVCQTSPDACLSALIMNFFNTFASWPWPTPVALQDGMMPVTPDVTEKRNWIPIRLPCSPYRCCQSNVTRSTFNRIRAEFLRGHRITQLEEIRVSCDPNPTEYADIGNVDSEPSVVFYWGLTRCMGINVTSLEKDFRDSITNNYRGMPGKMELSTVPASELPDISQFPTRKKKGMKACWKIPEYDQQRIPVYSRHLPNYFIGYVASEEKIC